MKNSAKDARQNSVRILEIAGVAGSGKTTISEKLAEQQPNLQRIASFRDARSSLDFAVEGMLIAPQLLRHFANGGKLSNKEILWMVRLKAILRILARQFPTQNGGAAKIVLLDQGPVYMLSRLLEKVQCSHESLWLEQWWNSVATQWADQLDAIIWLDAPDNVLLRRIQQRTKWHFAKDKADSEALAILVKHRLLHQQALHAVDCGKRAVTWRFDTSRADVTQIVAQVCADLKIAVS